MKLKSIKEEAADCRKAFDGFELGGYALHCHHDRIGETLTEPAENRIACILTQKPENERALRLRLFRPVPEKKLKAYAAWRKADAAWEKADAEREKADAEREKADAEREKAYAALGVLIHARFCSSDCPWNGKTIFT